MRSNDVVRAGRSHGFGHPNRWSLSVIVMTSLGGCLVPVDDAVDATEASLAVTPQQNDPTSVSRPTSPDPYLARGACRRGELFFNGRCRGVEFFERFLSDGAELAGVSGPVNTRADDSGVIVLERLADNWHKQLYVLPHGPRGRRMARFAGYDYRASYPVVYAESVLNWIDDHGYSHMLYERFAPQPRRGPGLGLVSWAHYGKTISGYEIEYSSGEQVSAIEDGGSGGYCDTAASGAKSVATGICIGADLAVAAASGTVAGVLSGAAVFLIGTSASVGIGSGPAFAAGVAAGTAVGAAVFGGIAAAGAVACGPLGEFAEAATADLCEHMNGPDPAEAIDFAPLAPSIPVYPDSSGECPVGMTRYSGEAVVCQRSNSSSTTIIDGEEVEEVSVTITCATTWVTNTCVYL